MDVDTDVWHLDVTGLGYGTYEEGEVDDYEHRTGADGAAEDAGAAPLSVVVITASTSTDRTDGATSPAVVEPATVHMRLHRHRAHHPVVHRRRFRSRDRQAAGSEVGNRGRRVDRVQTKTGESQACLRTHSQITYLYINQIKSN